MIVIVVAVSCFSINASAVSDTGSSIDYTLFCDYLPFPCKDFTDTSLDDYEWFMPEYVRNFCDKHYDVDFSDYYLLYTVQQPSIPTYTVWFAKPLSEDSKLQLYKSGNNYNVGAYGDWDVYNVGFQYFPDGQGERFNYYNIYHKWNGTINSSSLAYCDLPILNPDGYVINDNYNASIFTTSDGSQLVGDVTASKKSLTVSMSVADPRKFPLTSSVFGRCDSEDKLTLTIDLTKVRTELEDKDINFDACIGLLTVTDEDGIVKEYICSLDGTGEKDGLFSKEKELTPFTDIEDYVDWDFDPFPGFDPEHPIDSIANILSWIGGIIKKIVLNLVGILRWLKDNSFIFIENIGKLLYNLVVKLRNLIEALFIPDVNKIFKKINVFVPVEEISSGIKNLQDSIHNHGFTFTLLGQEVNFYISNYIPQDAASVLRSLSSFLILAFGLISCYNTILSFAGIAVANTVKEDK